MFFKTQPIIDSLSVTFIGRISIPFVRSMSIVTYSVEINRNMFSIVKKRFDRELMRRVEKYTFLDSFACPGKDILAKLRLQQKFFGNQSCVDCIAA